jgi:hypothetical protein
MPKVSIGVRADGTAVDVVLSPRTRQLDVRAAWNLTRVDLSAVAEATAVEKVVIDSNSAQLVAIDLGPLAGHPALTELHLRCRGLHALDLAPLASVARLRLFNCVFGDAELDVTPLVAHPSLAEFGYGNYVIDPFVDVSTVSCPGVLDLVARQRLTWSGVRKRPLAGVPWSFGTAFDEREAFVAATREAIAEEVTAGEMAAGALEGWPYRPRASESSTKTSRWTIRRTSSIFGPTGRTGSPGLSCCGWSTMPWLSG